MLAQPRLGNNVDAAARASARARHLLTLYWAMPPRHRTNREIEVKLRIDDLPGLLRKLKRLSARQRGRVLEQNTLYDTPDSDLRSRGGLLRLRVETPAPSKLVPGGAKGALLTAKAPVPVSRPGRLRYKEKLERELAVQSPGRWPSALRAIGLRPTFRYEKYRTTFRLRGLHLDLDETPVGIFLELEGSPRSIDRAARALGFAPNAYINGTYWDLYAADCRRHGCHPTNMLFRA